MHFKRNGVKIKEFVSFDASNVLKGPKYLI